jgi:hypothetical protein
MAYAYGTLTDANEPIHIRSLSQRVAISQVCLTCFLSYHNAIIIIITVATWLYMTDGSIASKECNRSNVVSFVGSFCLRRMASIINTNPSFITWSLPSFTHCIAFHVVPFHEALFETSITNRCGMD